MSSLSNIGRTDGAGQVLRTSGLQRSPRAPFLESDQIQLSGKARSIADYTEQVKAMPEVRADLVAHFQDQIQKRQYPPPAIVEGLIRLIGSPDWGQR